MKRTLLTATVATLLLTALSVAPAWADWSDNFNSGAQQSWTFAGGGHGVVALPSGATTGSTAAGSPLFSVDTTPGYLHVADNSSTASANFVAGWVSPSFTNIRISGTINPGTAGVNNNMGLLARADVSIGNAYGLTLDFNATGHTVDLVKVVGGSTSTGFDVTSSIASLSSQNSYYLELTVDGSGTTANLLGNVWDSSAKTTLLATVSTTDSSSPYTTGNAGVFASLSGSDPINGSWDDVAATSAVPEPASLLLLLAGGGLLAFRRRRTA